MKLAFTQPQLAYLFDKVGMLTVAVHENNVDDSTRSTVRKMRNKFTPNSSYVWLSQKERSLLFSLLEYRLRALIDAKMPSEEMTVVSELMDALAGGSNGVSETHAREQ